MIDNEAVIAEFALMADVSVDVMRDRFERGACVRCGDDIPEGDTCPCLVFVLAKLDDVPTHTVDD